MGTDTIAAGLGKYAIGAKLRRLRLGKSMGLLELSKHTGLSPALLSKVERDLMHPTLPTLLRIAMVFSVGLDYFFRSGPEPVRAVVRKRERMRFPDSADVSKPAYCFESLDFPVSDRTINAYLAEFEPRAPGEFRPHVHAGIEFLYVLGGKLEVSFNDGRHELREGDAMYFDATVPHGYRRLGAARTRAIVVTSVR